MSALLLALVLSIVLDQDSGSQRIASRVGDDIGATGRVIGSLMLAVIGNAALAVLAGGMLGGLMPAEARLLFFACTLLIGGVGLLLTMMRSQGPGRAASRPSLQMIGLFSLRRAGENTALATAGVALFTQAPLLTALGATIGGLAALLPALILGRRYRAIMPTRLIAGIAGTILTCTAIACTIRALGLSGT